MAVDSEIKHCKLCERKTLHHRNQSKVSNGGLIVLLVIIVATGGLALIFILPAMFLSSVSNGLKRWCCSECGGKAHKQENFSHPSPIQLQDRSSSGHIGKEKVIDAGWGRDELKEGGVKHQASAFSSVIAVTVVVTILLAALSGGDFKFGNKERVNTSAQKGSASSVIVSNNQSNTNASHQVSEANVAKVCKATISVVMVRPVEIISAVRTGRGQYRLSYIRADDETEWKYKCKLEGDRVLWGAHDGRWRTHSEDSIIKYRIVGDILTITEQYGSEVAIARKFAISQL